MDQDFELKYHRLEESHWWFQARRSMVGRLISDQDRRASILDLGCSSGILMLFLKQLGFEDVSGIDLSPQAVDLCHRRGLTNVFVMRGEKTNFPDNKFEIIIASDVLEHIAESAQALKEWHRILKPGGRLIIFVPAFQFLWNAHDEKNQHYRRYSREEIERVLQNVPFKIERSSYWNFLLFFPVAAARLLNNFLSRNNIEKKDQLFELPRWVNKSFCTMLEWENRFLKTGTFPWGVSVFAVARKV